MKFLAVRTVAVGLLLLAVAGCSTSTDISFEDAWDRINRLDASYELDLKFDFLTGELGMPSTENSLGLSLPEDATMQPDMSKETLEKAFLKAEKERCESYVQEGSTDLLSTQSRRIEDVLFHTVIGSSDRNYSKTYTAANEEIAELVDTLFPDDPEIKYGSEEYKFRQENIEELKELRWQEWVDENPQLEKEKEDITAYNKAVRASVYTAPSVKKVQDLFIQKCRLQVSEEYQYPTPEELGIKLEEVKE